MDEIIKELIVNVPIAAVLLWQLRQVYGDLKDRMAKADDERGKLIDAVIDNTRRTKIVEKTATGEISPTIHRRADLT